MVRTAINVYSVRELDESVSEVLDRVAAAGYDGVQFSGRHTPLAGDPATIREKLIETGLDVAPAHVDAETLESDLERVIDAYGTVGAPAAVVPYLPPADFRSAAAVTRTADRLSELARALESRDWPLHYHNHEHEFVDVDGASAFTRLLEATDVAIELDVGWAAAGGGDPATLLRRLGERCSLVHFKDVSLDPAHDRGGRPVEIGTGDVDLSACAAAARETDVEWFIYEHDTPDDPAESIERGAEVLESL